MNSKIMNSKTIILVAGLALIGVVSACDEKDYTKGMQQCVAYCKGNSSGDLRAEQRCQASCRTTVSQLANNVRTTPYGPSASEMNKGGSHNESWERNPTASLHYSYASVT